MVKVLLGSFGAFPIFWQACILKTDGHPGVIPRISDFRQVCISNTAGRKAKRNEIWASGVSI